MANVLLITKNGDGFNDDGLNYMYKMIESKSLLNESYLVSMGDYLNEPKRLLEILETPDTTNIIMLAYKNDIGGSALIPIHDEDINVIKNMLSDMLDSDKSAWELITNLLIQQFDECFNELSDDKKKTINQLKTDLINTKN